MTRLIDDEPEGVNTPEFTVSGISAAVRRTVEGNFGFVRVRGELGRVSAPRSGHLYLDLKDDRAVLAGVIWKTAARGIRFRPEEGMEVVATGRLTTFPGQSKYQMIIETLAPAGVGALMAMLEERKKKLAAEGLFDPERKRPLPFLPRVIGVVTSPSGAVIRDILHRLGERFPVRVLVWPVAVQGERCAADVARAIRGFGQMQGQDRPDVLIVARGGGSVEDLWGFNEEEVVRAAAESPIPLISAVGHETDTTLIDHAADRRAPTPTAAAEMAVPVRTELAAGLGALGTRLLRGLTRSVEDRRQRLRDLSRALPRPQDLLALPRQKLDRASERLPQALVATAQTARLRMARGPAGRFGPQLLRLPLQRRRERLEDRAARLIPPLGRIAQAARLRFLGLSRLLYSLSYKGTLGRGYAVLRQGGAVISSAEAAKTGHAEIELADGRVEAAIGVGLAARAQRKAARPRTKEVPPPPRQGTLF